MLGAALGEADGVMLGAMLGPTLGVALGLDDGEADGELLGLDEGEAEGLPAVAAKAKSASTRRKKPDAASTR